jgi:response regulator of citrate/malate metabolism
MKSQSNVQINNFKPDFSFLEFFFSCEKGLELLSMPAAQQRKKKSLYMVVGSGNSFERTKQAPQKISLQILH